MCANVRRLDNISFEKSSVRQVGLPGETAPRVS
jgi:hypothetical protein